MDFGEGIGSGAPTNGPEGSRLAPMPKKYNPSHANPSIERINRLYGYTIAIPAFASERETEFGIGTLGLPIELLGVAVLCALPLWMAFAERMYLVLLGITISYTAIMALSAIVSLAVLCAGFVLAKPYVRKHKGASLACGIFTHIAPVQIVAGLLFVPLSLVGVM